MGKGEIMGRLARLAFALGALVWLGLGCGIVGEEFEAGNQLKVTSVADRAGSNAPVFAAVEETDDSGVDGQAGTNDDGEDDGFPDPGETVVNLLSIDTGVLSLENEPRLGVGENGVELQVFRVDVTYFDANGAAQAFAPQRSLATTATVPNQGAVDLEFELVPLSMKLATGGLRDIFLFGTAAQRAAVERMTAVVDVWAKDMRNNDTVHAQGQIAISFINPMAAQTGQ
jgi:hypothetical protein